ncbi:MAG: hypothetical protein IJ181_07205 [Acidaminococcaceae bacterium]|nr:hypothetical protein [Acidaminococcaceae bacterium]
MIHYIADPRKNVWQAGNYVELDRLKGWMVPDDPDNPDAIFAAFMAPHHAYADVRKESRLFYHVFLDFGGMVSPEQAIELGWQIAMWFRQFHVPYLQGLHSVKAGREGGNNPEFWPHVHWLVSTRMLDGSGKKLHIGKAELRNLKIFANEVLAAHGLPLIVMKKE